MTAKDLNMQEELKCDHFKVSIFGSARVKPGDEAYDGAYELAKNIAGLGMDVITGGGPGVMGAASQGHKDGDPDDKVHTIGINIKLPEEQEANPGLEMVKTHERFSTRLDDFMLLSNIAVVMPGGIGTCLEFFYTWQLIQVNHICHIPLILVGDMWRNIINWVVDNPLKDGYLSSKDLESVVLVDNAEEAFEVIKVAKQHFDESGKDVCVNWKKYGKKF
jgi:uncharacterized protein (TIGR00730 family)